MIPIFGTSWAWAGSAAELNRIALRTLMGGVSSLSTDPSGREGRRVVINATGDGNNPSRWAEWAIRTDPGTHWTMGCWYGMPGSDSGGFGRVVFALTNEAGNLGVHMRTIVAGSNPQARRVEIRIGGTSIYEFPSGSGSTVVPYRVEVVEHASEGIVRLWRDDEFEAELTGLNTSRGFAFDRIRMGSGAISSRHSHIAHPWVIEGGDLNRPLFGGWSALSSDEAPNEWTRSNGALAHHEHLAAPSDGDTTHLHSDAEGVGNKSRHGVAVPPDEDRGIFAVRPVAVARGLDRVSVSLESGEAAPAASVLSGYDEDDYEARMGDWLDEDPETEGPWERQAVGDLTAEIEHLAPE